jgi:putative sigma-54 modulation protein
MQIEVKGRQMAITDELRDHVNRRFDKIARQVSDLARLDVELSLEPNRALPDRYVAEATLHLKGTVLRASDASRDITHSINLCADELARQVKRNRDKRRRRREARSAELPTGSAELPTGSAELPEEISPAS